MTVVDILIPMLGRAHQAEEVASSAARGTSLPYHLLFLCSPEDGETIDACSLVGDVHVVGWPAGDGDYAMKINAGCFRTSSTWILTGASDIHFHPGWLEAALAVRDAKPDAMVIGTNDLGNPTVMKGKHSTHTLINRFYIDSRGAGWDGPGVVFHEGYEHQFVDTELVEVAQARDVWAFAFDSHVEHHHPFWKKGTMDATYRKGLSGANHDRDLFRQRRRLYLSA